MEDRAGEFGLTNKESSQEGWDMPLISGQAAWLKSLSSEIKRKGGIAQGWPAGRHSGSTLLDSR